MVKKKFSVLVFSIILTVVALSTLGAMVITVIAPTENPYVTPDNTVNLSYGIDASDGLSSITHSWNGTNYTLYDSSLVLFMNFDNRSELGENDTFVRDLSMYGNNGTVVGGENISWVSDYGKYNGAFEFSGNKAGINLGNVLSFSTNDFSISLWYYSLSGSKQNILAKYSNGYDIYTQSGAVFFELYNGSSHPVAQVNDIGYNKWVYLTVVKNSTNIAIYINGEFEVSTTILSELNITSTKNFVIGSNSDLNNQFLNGSIDDIMIWNKSLTTNEIEYLYKTQITKYNESYLEYNITNNNNSIISINHFLCSVNSTGTNFCSATQTISKGSILTANFSNSIGIINPNFYGVNLNPYYLTNNNYNFARSSLLNLNTNFIRMNMKFNSYSTSEGNYDSIEMAKKQELLDWAKSNNLKVLWIAHEMPNWLANTEGGCTVNKTCPPTNYTKWGILVTEFLQEVGCNPDICEVEVWNEPDETVFWMDDTVVTNISRSKEYNKLYNATYLAVKSLNPNYQVGGPATTSTDAGTRLIIVNWMSNFTNQIDFVSHHDYLDVSSSVKFYDDSLNNVYSWIYANITDLGVNTSRVLIDEYNILNDAVRLANGKNWSMQLGLAYEETLNSYPDNVSMIEYHFTENEVNQFQMFNYTNNFFFASYNVTKNFAHLCPAGATVYVTSGDDSDIKQVSCKKGNQYSLIVINTGTKSKNITANLSMENGTVVFPYANLVNYEDDTTTYKVSSDGIAQLGVMDSYEILYLYSGVEDGALLRGVFKLNEGSGNTIYDSLQNLSNGVKSGATWVTDGVLKSLSSVTDYSISSLGLLVLNNEHLFNYLNASWSYLATWRDTGSTASLVMVDSLGNSTTFLSLLIVISFAVVILTLFKPSINTNPLGKPHY